MVWNWRKNEMLGYTQIMQNVMISSLDWHPTFACVSFFTIREDIVLITCGTAVYLWNYAVISSFSPNSQKSLIVNLFPNSVLKYQFAFFYGDGKNFIACLSTGWLSGIAHENLVNREPVKTFTICKYHLVKDVTPCLVTEA